MTDKFDWGPHKGGSGDFVKFEQIGDSVTGTIVAIREHTFDKDKGPVPLIDISPRAGGENVTLSVDKVDLRFKLAEAEPQVGDELRVKYSDTERTPNGTKKVFQVEHRRAVPKPARAEDEKSPGPENVEEYGEDMEPF